MGATSATGGYTARQLLKKQHAHGCSLFFGLNLVYASTNGGEINKIIEDNSKDQFANGHSSHSLRVNSDATEPQIQLNAGATTLEEFITKLGKDFA
jgi:hypothetical protein